MKKILTAVLILMFSVPLNLYSANKMNTRGMTSAQITARILGYWKTVDRTKDNAQAVIAVYNYNGEIYGRVIAFYNPDTYKIEDDIYQQKNRAPAIRGNPPYCGLDILFGLKHGRGARFDGGEILNPENGRYYHASVKLLENNTLKITARYLFFRRNQALTRIENSDFPGDFTFPDINTFIPVIPVVNK